MPNENTITRVTCSTSIPYYLSLDSSCDSKRESKCSQFKCKEALYVTKKNHRKISAFKSKVSLSKKVSLQWTKSSERIVGGCSAQNPTEYSTITLANPRNNSNRVNPIVCLHCFRYLVRICSRCEWNVNDAENQCWKHRMKFSFSVAGRAFESVMCDILLWSDLRYSTRMRAVLAAAAAAAVLSVDIWGMIEWLLESVFTLWLWYRAYNCNNISSFSENLWNWWSRPVI